MSADAEFITVRFKGDKEKLDDVKKKVNGSIEELFDDVYNVSWKNIKGDNGEYLQVDMGPEIYGNMLSLIEFLSDKIVKEFPDVLFEHIWAEMYGDLSIENTFYDGKKVQMVGSLPEFVIDENGKRIELVDEEYGCFPSAVLYDENGNLSEAAFDKYGLSKIGWTFGEQDEEDYDEDCDEEFDWDEGFDFNAHYLYLT